MSDTDKIKADKVKKYKDRRNALILRKPDLMAALTAHTKEQLNKILVNLNSNWEMSKKDMKKEGRKKTDYYDWILFEIYGEDSNSEVEAWIDGIIERETWVYERDD